MKIYEEEIAKCSQNMIHIQLDNDTMKKINNFVNEVVLAKKNEAHHKKDSSKEHKRFTTGMMGECAIVKYYGYDIDKTIDWTVGESTLYDHADLRALGLNVGVKASAMGNFPLVHKKAKHPEIICVRKEPDIVIICGLATEDILNFYQDDTLVLTPQALGRKTAFYGYEALLPLPALEELKKRYPIR